MNRDMRHVYTHSRLGADPLNLSTTSEGTTRTVCRSYWRYGGQTTKAGY